MKRAFLNLTAAMAAAGFFIFSPAIAHVEREKTAPVETAEEKTLRARFDAYYSGSFELQGQNKMAEAKKLEQQYIGPGFTSTSEIIRSLTSDGEERLVNAGLPETTKLARNKYMKAFDTPHQGPTITGTIESVEIRGDKAAIRAGYEMDEKNLPALVAMLTNNFPGQDIRSVKSSIQCLYTLDLAKPGDPVPFQMTAEVCQVYQKIKIMHSTPA